jgi:hypothetical protein
VVDGDPEEEVPAGQGEQYLVANLPVLGTEPAGQARGLEGAVMPSTQPLTTCRGGQRGDGGVAHDLTQASATGRSEQARIVTGW